MAEIVANTKTRERPTCRFWELERLIGLGYTRQAALALMAAYPGVADETLQQECADATPNALLPEIESGQDLGLALSA